ncbi:MAG: Na+:solute symporter [Leptospiraceae bacterium]|nr:Na+:solute symporter [Leptospiraceae bacterium]MCP5494466.1 Na+:solute symporter [Leptospiraceae bacterium]
MIGISLLDLLIIFVSLLVTVSIPLYFKNKENSLREYFQSSGRLSWFVSGTAMVATTFSADTPLAVTELVATNGISGNWLWWYGSIGSIITVYFFAPLWKKSGAMTDVELVKLRYSGKGVQYLRIFKSVYLGFFINILILSWVNLAMYKISRVLLPSVPPEIVVSILFLLAFAYTSLMGLSGISYADTFQFFFAMASCVALAFFVLNLPEIGGISGLKKQLNPEVFNFMPDFSNPKSNNLSIPSFLTFVLIVWWTSWYPGSEPGGGGYIAQRIMASKDVKSSILSTLWFTIAHYFVRPWPWIIVGLCSLVLFPDLVADRKGEGYIMVMHQSLPSGLLGLMIASFMAAYLSTVATHLNWGTSYLINDFYKPYVVENKPDNYYLFVSIFFQLVVMLVSLIITFYFIKTISGVWLFLLECGAGTGFVLIFRWFWWRLNVWSEFAAYISPIVFYSISKFYLGLLFPYSLLFTAFCTIAVTLVVTMITPETNIEVLIRFYKTVLPPGKLWRNWAIRNEINPVSGEGSIGRLVLLTFAGVFMVFSGLFSVGHLIFQNYQLMGVFMVLFILSMGITIYYFPEVHFEHIVEKNQEK